MRIVLRKRAIADINDIVEYIASDDAFAALGVRDRIAASIQLLSKQPGAGQQTSVRGLRKWPIPGLPYVIYFRVHGRELRVTRVFDGRRLAAARLLR